MFQEHMRIVNIRNTIENTFLDTLRDAFQKEVDAYALTDAEINAIEDLVIATEKHTIRPYTGSCSVCDKMIDGIALFDNETPMHVYKCIKIDLENLVITIRKDGGD